MRTQRRPAVTVTLVHVVDNNLAGGDTTNTTIEGAVFEPNEPTVGRVGQVQQPAFRSGVFNLPSAYIVELGDTLIADGVEWLVLEGGTVWLDRTRVPVGADVMPDRVSLRVPGGTGPTWNDATHRSEVTPFAPFATDVPARVQALTGRNSASGGDQVVADDEVRVAGYLVAIPLTGVAGTGSISAAGEDSTLVDVTTSADPLLVGKTLRVIDIVRGSHRAERLLFCTLND